MLLLLNNHTLQTFALRCTLQKQQLPCRKLIAFILILQQSTEHHITSLYVGLNKGFERRLIPHRNKSVAVASVLQVCESAHSTHSRVTS
eukprot:m.96185 g.96185  ORF g.96185 m.96185 type:complete len:89 (+) comp13066_c0_seq1:407-673(+)